GDGPLAESTVAARLAAAEGVPAEAILVEARSHTTEENARAASDVLPADARRVVGVRDAYHVLRAEPIFRRYLALATGAGTVAEAWPRAKGALREVLAVTAWALTPSPAGSARRSARTPSAPDA